MASTCADIVRRAFRYLGVTQGGQLPSGTDTQDGFEYLQGMILALPGMLMNGVWHEREVTGVYTAMEGDRCTVLTGGSVTLPTTITTCDDDWSDPTTYDQTRPPMDLARVQILGAAAANPGLWLYSATKAAWSRVDDLSIEDAIPFGEEDVRGLSAMLAIDMMDDYGDQTQVSPRTVALAEQQSRSFRARFKKAEPEDKDRPGTWRRPRRDWGYF